MGRVISYNNRILTYGTRIIEGAIAFDPSTIPNLQIWVKADAGITLNKGGVSNWANQSNGGSDYDFIQTTAASQPLYVLDGINGLPTLRFNGSTSTMYQLVSRSYAGGKLTFFVVMKIADAGILSILGSQLYERDIDGNGTIMYGLYGQASGLCYVGYNYSGEQVPISNKLTIGQVYIISNKNVSGPGSFFYRNGTDIGSAFGSDANTFQNLGSTKFPSNTMGGFFNGDISEILIYEKMLSDTEMSSVNKYLNSKYSAY